MALTPTSTPTSHTKRVVESVLSCVAFGMVVVGAYLWYGTRQVPGKEFTKGNVAYESGQDKVAMDIAADDYLRPSYDAQRRKQNCIMRAAPFVLKTC